MDDLATLDVDDIAEGLVKEEEPEDATYDELVSWINTMNEDHQCQIVALAWIGRRYCGGDDFDDALARE